MRAEFVDKEGAELGVAALAEHFPHIGVAQGGEGGDLELEEVVLGRVKIHGVDPAGLLQGEGEDVVAGAGDGENDIVGGDFQNAGIGSVVFPGEGVDVAVVEAAVFCQGLIEVNSPVVVLVPSSWSVKAFYISRMAHTK